MCLGLGLVGMATGDEKIYEELKNVLYSNSAVAGEAAGLGIGLTMLGKASDEKIQDLLTFADDTKHEKIIRALSMSFALFMYEREEQADTLIE